MASLQECSSASWLATGEGMHQGHLCQLPSARSQVKLPSVVGEAAAACTKAVVPDVAKAFQATCLGLGPDDVYTILLYLSASLGAIDPLSILQLDPPCWVTSGQYRSVGVLVICPDIA